MIRLIKASKLAQTLGISRRTVVDWCSRDPALAVRKNGAYWLRVSELAKRPGMDIVSVLMTTREGKWLKVVDLAKLSGIPRRTLAHWAKTRPHFGRRLGRNWYVSAEVLSATQEQAEFLQKWVPGAKSAVKLATFAGDLSK